MTGHWGCILRKHSGNVAFTIFPYASESWRPLLMLMLIGSEWWKVIMFIFSNFAE